MITQLMSIFQPSMRHIEKAKEKKLSQTENGDNSKRKYDLDKILKEGLSPNSFKQEK